MRLALDYGEIGPKFVSNRFGGAGMPPLNRFEADRNVRPTISILHLPEKRVTPSAMECQL
jgi:hypothetical protein